MSIKTVPLRCLQASERQTLRMQGLVRDMSKLLRDNPVDGSAELIAKAEAVEAGIDQSLPDSDVENEWLRGIIKDAIHHLQNGGLTPEFVINELEAGLT